MWADAQPSVLANFMDTNLPVLGQYHMYYQYSSVVLADTCTTRYCTTVHSVEGGQGESVTSG